MDALLATITLLDQWLKGNDTDLTCVSASMNMQWEEVRYLWKTYVWNMGMMSGT